MLNPKLQDKTLCSEVGERTKVCDIIECTLKQRWKMGQTYNKNEGTVCGLKATQNDIHGEGRVQGDDQAEDWKTT